jgi:hypothetical protein
MKIRVGENELWPAYYLRPATEEQPADDRRDVIEVDEEFMKRWEQATNLFYSMQDEIRDKLFAREREIEESKWSPEFQYETKLRRGPIEFEGKTIISMRQAIDQDSHYIEPDAVIFAVFKGKPGLFIVKEVHSQSCLIGDKDKILGWCRFTKILGFPNEKLSDNSQ